MGGVLGVGGLFRAEIGYVVGCALADGGERWTLSFFALNITMIVLLAATVY
jgi:hypothetical protein